MTRELKHIMCRIALKCDPTTKMKSWDVDPLPTPHRMDTISWALLATDFRGDFQSGSVNLSM